jgi:pimeloyl-ACP methyl ester carboxylesterase
MNVTRRRRPVPTLTKLLLAVAAGLLLALAIDVIRTGGWDSWLARHHLAPPYDARGERIDIGGRWLYLDCRGTGEPTVVLEAGSGSDSATWSAVIDALAATTRTCAYDRAGRARSDPTDARTLHDAATELRVLLSTAGETAPFLLAGHSLGGSFVRVFASQHRDEVVGLVMVDTFDPDLQVDRIHPLVGDLRAEYEATLDGLRGTVASVDSLDWPTSEEQLRASDVRGLPIEILRPARYEPRLSEAQNREIAAAVQAAYESLSPGRVGWTIAWGAGHNVQVDRPDLVIQSVRRLIDKARAAGG